MKTRPCCGRKSAAPGTSRASTAFQRLREFAKWAGPGAVFLAMPKCPACVAAYIALCTGVGISLSAAAQLRIGVLTLSIAILVWLAAKRMWTIAIRAKSDSLKTV